MAQLDDDRNGPRRESADMRQLLAIALIVLTACGGTNPAGSTGPGGSGAASGSSSDFPEINPADVTAEAVAALEAGVVRSALIGSAGAKTLSDDLLDEIEAARQEILALSADDTAALGRTASADVSEAPPADLAVAATATSVVDTLIEQVRRQATSRSGSNPELGIHTSDRVTSDGGARINSTSQTTVTSTSTTLSGTHRLSMTIERLDADGQVTSTIYLEIEATVEMDICPDANGNVKATYTYDTSSDMVGGSTMTVHTEGTVEGLVGDDAYLHSYIVEASGTESSTGGGGSGYSRGVTTRSGYALSGAPGVASQTTTAIPSVTTITQSDPLATTQDYVDLQQAATGPAHWMSLQLLDVAQSKWRSGACVRIESSRDSDYVNPSEHVPFTAKVFHKVENVELNKPIVATFTGVTSLDPVDTEVPAPADFEFVAGPHIDDVGDIKLKTTSNRGIGELALRFKVKQLQLELTIDSEIGITKVDSFITDATATATGTIRLTPTGAPGKWSGTGTLDSVTATSLGVGGCQTAQIYGVGTYDWVVREVTAAPGMAEGDIEIWSDSGQRRENPDTITSLLCPAGAVTNPYNTWENFFFLVFRGFYGPNGFQVDGLSDGPADTSEWEHDMVLGTDTWVTTCGISLLPEQLRQYTDCAASVTWTLKVIDPSVSP